MGISNRIRIAIEALDLSLREAAGRCSIPYSSLQNWVGGHREPRIESVVTIGSQLGISIDWLLTGEGPMLRYNNAVEVQESGNAMPSQTSDPREQALLALFRELGEAEQREIHNAAEEKKRLKTLEQRVAELEAVVSDIKKMA